MKYFCLQQILFQQNDDNKISEIYEIFTEIQELGKGTDCIAYKAKNCHGSYVVVSEFLPRKYRKRDFTRSETGCAVISGVKFEKEKEKFLEEYRTQLEIQHTNTFTGNQNSVMYAGGNTLYMVMTYDGEPLTKNTLEEFINECTGQSIDFVKIILQELKKYAEEISLIHRKKMLLLDIKPDNFILTKSGTQILYRRIIDYGSCQKIEELHSLQNQETEISSNEFAPPEVMNKEYPRINTWSDIFLFANTVFYFLTGSQIDRYDLRERTAEEFKTILIENYDKFHILANQSNHFFVLLHHFFDYTLSDDCDIMPHELSQDEIKILMNETRESTVKKRLRSMKEVISILELLTGDQLYPELEESCIRARINRELQEFREEYYGMSAEKQKNQALFSESLLPVFRREHDSLTIEELIEHLFTQKGVYYLSGQSGSGKTTAMKYIACRTAEIFDQKVPIPLYVKLTELIFFAKDKTENSICQYLSEKLFGKPVNEQVQAIYQQELQNYLDGVSNRAKLLLFFDGVNEIGHYPHAAKLINECQKIAQKAHVTAVFSGHDQKLEHPFFKGIKFTVSECTEEKIADYLAALTQKGFLFWHPENLEESVVRRTLKSLRTPLLAHCFAARFFEINPIDESQIPKNEALLLEQYLYAFGTNCTYERILAIFSEEKIRVVPYADFLMTQVSKVCLAMTVEKRKTVSEREILSAVENGLQTVVNPDGSITRKIGSQNISREDYRKMIAIHTYDNASWLSHFFTMYTQGEFEIVHSSIGTYLAAKYFGECLKKTNVGDIHSFPECIWQPDLPEELFRMTAMLLSDEDIRTFCRKFKKRYGGTMKRFLRKQLHDINMSDDRIILDNGTVANFETAGHYLRELIRFMDIPEHQKANLKKGLPDNQADRILTKAFSALSHREISEEEKEKLGSAIQEISSDPQALYLARWLWKNQSGLSFKNKISVFLAARQQIEKITADFLESHQFSGSPAAEILDILIGFQTLFPEKYTKLQLIQKCIESVNLELPAALLEKLFNFLDNLEILKICPELMNTFGAVKFLKIVREDCQKNQYSAILTQPLSSDLLHSISLAACAEWNFKDRDYYPEKFHSSLAAEKHTIYKQVTEEKQGKAAPNIQEIKNSNMISLLIRQFCLAEYEIHHTGDHVTASSEQLYALTQLYIAINYSISQKTGRMIHTHFSQSGTLPIEYDKKRNMIYSPDILMALMGLELFDAVPCRSIWQFCGYYLRDFPYASLLHLNPKEYLFLIIFGIVLIYQFIQNPLMMIQLLLIGVLVLTILSAGWGILYLLWIIIRFFIHKAINAFINGLRQCFKR